jgi:hypothetical protein
VHVRAVDVQAIASFHHLLVFRRQRGVNDNNGVLKLIYADLDVSDGVRVKWRPFLAAYAYLANVSDEMAPQPMGINVLDVDSIQ